MRFIIFLLLALLLTSLIPFAFAEETVLIDVQTPEYFTTGTSPYLHYPLGFLNRGVELKVEIHVNVGHTSIILAERHLPTWAETRDHNLAIYNFNNSGETRPYVLTFPRPIPADDRYVFVVFTGAGGGAQLQKLRITATGLSPETELTPSVVAEVVENLTQVQTNIVNLQQNINNIENNILQLNQELTNVAGDLVNVQNSTATMLNEINTTNVMLEKTFANFEGTVNFLQVEVGIGVTLLGGYLVFNLYKSRKSS